ncbi:MAG: Reverse gyrase [Acinetobacter bereziniae]|uniref:Reverse gyrase n=1 Tax=Acinetobacter bereziniae TaxID=106648 RepID=A0A833PAZ0_ACIBZ|nr:MAG: Reverse gyrase [Acinetobacter bereziniae]
MAFKKPVTKSAVPDGPDRLFNDLPRRKHASLFDHQGQILRSYVEKALNEKDIAIQLPTGSGKTLVGLLLAEWRRRKFNERVVFLCPTRQLVNQVVEEANNKYGLQVEGFVGSAKYYSPDAKSAYLDGNRVAVTTYNSLFNTRPFFNNADVIIIDDAHAAENYLQSLWTFSVSRTEESDVILYKAISGVLKAVLPEQNFARLLGAWSGIEDATWVDKIPTKKLLTIAHDLRATINAHLSSENNQRYAWGMLQDHLNACQLYVSSNEILIKPLIPPTWVHSPFTSAKQRIYMSATLGLGGDLERLTGRPDIKRLPIPAGWDTQGIGRRFFIFPEKSLDSEQIVQLRRTLMTKAGRSIVLTSNNEAAKEISNDVDIHLGFPVFTANELENSKSDFIENDQAVAVIANRYDGIDFPEDDCRLLFVDGLSQSINLQERFFINKMGASLLFNDRIQTRALQAIGRCTRGLNDYSAVIITGDELSCYLTDSKKRKYFHPELQAELEFGIYQSTEADIQDLIENFEIFFEHETDWEDANQSILESRAIAVQEQFPAMEELSHAVKYEIKWQKALWSGDSIEAREAAREVLSVLKHPDLKGYRALWQYYAGSAADQAYLEGHTGFDVVAREHYLQAKKIAIAIPWLTSLSREMKIVSDEEKEDQRNVLIMQQIEQIESNLINLGLISNTKFVANEAKIRQGLSKPESFEMAQVELGKYLGFSANKVESEASPDPWWFKGDFVIVFEDHVDAETTSSLSATKARQVASHPKWLNDHDQSYKNCKILPVILTPVTKARDGAIPHLEGVSYWGATEFIEWSEKVLNVIRELRKIFDGPGNLAWRAIAAEELSKINADVLGLFEWLADRPAQKYLISIPD